MCFAFHNIFHHYKPIEIKIPLHCTYLRQGQRNVFSQPIPVYDRQAHYSLLNSSEPVPVKKPVFYNQEAGSSTNIPLPGQQHSVGAGPLSNKVREYTQQKSIINIIGELTQLVKNVKIAEKDTKRIMDHVRILKEHVIKNIVF